MTAAPPQRSPSSSVEQLMEQLMLDEIGARIHLGLQIHDDVLPLLIAARMHLEVARTTPDDAATSIERSEARLTAGIEALRRTLGSLLNAATPGNVTAAINDVLDSVREQGLTTRLQTAGDASRVPFAIHALLVNAVKGLATNVIRHAKATTVDVTLAVGDDEASLTVIDDGVGFDATAALGASHGLGLLARRCELVGGEMTLTSAAGRGSTAVIRVPLSPAAGR